MDDYGRLPARLKLTADYIENMGQTVETIKKIAKKYPGQYPLWIGDASKISHEELISGQELDIKYKDTTLKVDVENKEFIVAMEDSFNIDIFDLGITHKHMV